MAVRVAIQGAIGANSEYGARAFFPDATIVNCKEFEDVFATLARGDADCLVIPIENTTAGTVYAYYDLLLGYAAREGFRVCGERKLRIWHHLMALPGVKVEGLTKVLSHSHALAQCKKFFAGHPWIERQPYYDTAGAAVDIQKNDWRTYGAIATKQIAHDLGMTVLQEKIQDRRDNITRFLWVQKGTAVEATADVRVSIAFCLHNLPGTLLSVIETLSVKAKVNIIRIESQNLIGTVTDWIDFRGEQGQVDGGAWDLIYYMDFVCAPSQTATILEDLSRLVMEVKGRKALQVLGTYPFEKDLTIDTTNELCRP